MSWDFELDRPIAVAGRRPLATMRDAATYITELPKALQDAPAWQTAIVALMEAAEERGPRMHAHIAVMRALHGRTDYVANPITKKDPHWGRRKLARDR